MRNLFEKTIDFLMRLHYNINRKGKQRAFPRAERIRIMKATFKINGKEVEFKKVSVIIKEDGKQEEIQGLLLHDIDDEFKNGDAITTEYTNLPEDEKEAQDLIINAYWDTYFSIDGEKYILKSEF